MDLFISFIHFIVLGLCLAAPIGPMNIEVMKRGLTEGFWSSWLVGIGGLTGDLLILIAIFFGLGDYMQGTFVQIMMYVFGSLILAYLGFTSIYSAIYQPVYKPDLTRPSSRHAFLSGLFISLANPLSLLFWFGIYGTSLHILTATHSLGFALLCSFAIILGLFLWNANLVFTVYFSKKMLHEKGIRGITLLAGFTLIGFGIYFFIQLLKLTMSM